jgi:hypothetical protein
MLSKRWKLVALVMLVAGLLWGQQLIASNRDPECNLIYPGMTGCIDSGCCLGDPGLCDRMCVYVPAIDDCDCVNR